MAKKLKIMHGMSEVAGQNYYAVKGLRNIGEDADTVVFYKHKFAYPYDRSLGIDKTKPYLLPWYAVKLSVFLVEALCKYNVFHFHFGRSICNNMDLWLYDLFKKKYFYEFHGSDLRIYPEYFSTHPDIPVDPELLAAPDYRKRNKRICAKAKQIILHDDELIPYLPENHVPVQVVPLRMDPLQFVPVYPECTNDKTIKIVHASTDRMGKGTDYIIQAVEELKPSYPNIELILVENKPQEEAKAIYKSADIIVDQLFFGTYGVFALEGMALGKPVVTYISEDMRQALPESLPMVIANKLTVKQALESLVSDPQKRYDCGVQSRKYVEDYHDFRKIGYILKGIYEGKLEPAVGRKAFERVKNITL